MMVSCDNYVQLTVFDYIIDKKTDLSLKKIEKYAIEKNNILWYNKTNMQINSEKF